MWTEINLVQSFQKYLQSSWFKQVMMPAMKIIPRNLKMCTSYMHPTHMTNQHTREQVCICEQQLLIWFFLFSVWRDVIHTNKWQHTSAKNKKNIHYPIFVLLSRNLEDISGSKVAIMNIVMCDNQRQKKLRQFIEKLWHFVTFFLLY